MIKLDVGVGSVAPLQLQIPFDHVVNHARIFSVCKCLEHVGVDAAALESVYRSDRAVRPLHFVLAKLHMWMFWRMKTRAPNTPTYGTEGTSLPDQHSRHATPAQVWFLRTDAAGRALLFFHRRCGVLRGPVHRVDGGTTLYPHCRMVAELAGVA